jgi:DDE superfamily endonuclease
MTFPLTLTVIVLGHPHRRLGHAFALMATNAGGLFVRSHVTSQGISVRHRLPSSRRACATPRCRRHGRVQKNFAERVAEIRAQVAPDIPVEVWFQDEMRVGQKNKLTYRWARKGSRPRAAHDQRTQSTYLFGAVCPERGAGAALVLPACNTEAMQLHLDEIAAKIAPGAHAILLLDQAGWHGAKALKVPNNISLLQLPPREPELNGQENIWQFMRQNWLSNRIFKSFAACRRFGGRAAPNTDITWTSLRALAGRRP